MPTLNYNLPYDVEQKLVDDIAYHFKEILLLLGQDLEDENLKDTPQRVARYYKEFLLDYDPGNYETSFESVEVDQLVVVKDIPGWSLCSHHLLNFSFKASVGYLAGSKVIGLSKIPRIVQKHAHKLQLQERLAEDIAKDLESILEDSKGIAVYIEGEHSCMRSRGIRSEGKMLTSVLKGQFRDDPQLRQEFLMLVK